jgi:hypothetical protein
MSQQDTDIRDDETQRAAVHPSRGEAPPFPDNRHLAKRIRIETHDLYIPPQASALAQQCGELFRDGHYQEGLMLAQSVADFATNATAQRQVGLGLAYLGRYAEARHYFQRGAELSTDRSTQANCRANIGTTFFEEGELERAEAAYRETLTLEPDNVFGLLGYLAVACQKEDVSMLVEATEQLVARHPAWQHNELIVATLVRDRSFRFLRATPRVFRQGFGMTPDELVVQRLQQELVATPAAPKPAARRSRSRQGTFAQLEQVLHHLAQCLDQVEQSGEPPEGGEHAPSLAEALHARLMELREVKQWCRALLLWPGTQTDYRHLSVEPDSVGTLLGHLIVACHQADTGGMLQAAQHLVSVCPDWQDDALIVATLVYDPALRLLRIHQEQFEQVFGMRLDTLAAQHSGDVVVRRPSAAGTGAVQLAQIASRVGQYLERVEQRQTSAPAARLSKALGSLRQELGDVQRWHRAVLITAVEASY